jgi:tRNA(adenine34) deaminase
MRNVPRESMPELLSDLERAVLDYLVEFLRQNTYQPSVREIANHLGIRSTRKVSELLGSLEQKGRIARFPGRSRGIQVLGADREPPGEVSPYDSPQFEAALPEDAHWMQQALAQAAAAASAEEVPVGAVLVAGGRIQAASPNLMRTLADPTAHAEMQAIRRAAAAAGQAWLTEATLYVTLEPCAMCAGAIVLARLLRLVFGASDPKSGMCGSLACIVQDRRLNHRVRLTRGVLAEESGDLLRTFFRARR